MSHSPSSQLDDADEDDLEYDGVGELCPDDEDDDDVDEEESKLSYFFNIDVGYICTSISRMVGILGKEFLFELIPNLSLVFGNDLVRFGLRDLLLDDDDDRNTFFSSS